MSYAGLDHWITSEPEEYYPQGEAEADDSGRIHALTALGYYVIAEVQGEALHYVYTDPRGFYKFQTEADAREVIRNNGLESFDGEGGYFVVGPRPKKSEPVVPAFDDDLPF